MSPPDVPPVPSSSGLSDRLRDFHATTLSGLYRWPREHFQVFVGRSDTGQVLPLPAPRWSYYADPFLSLRNGRLWVFAEQFLYLENAARLVAIPLDTSLRPAAAPVEIPLHDRAHASFPYVFDHGGDLFLLPETCSRGTIDLFRCLGLPGLWRHERCLLDGIDAADTVPLFHEGKWWLFTSVRQSRADGGHRSLAIFYGDDLLRSVWHPHPVNAEQRYALSPFSWGRCAGAFHFSPDGALLRPFQANLSYYGEALGWMRIERLTVTKFSESPVSSLPLCASPVRRVSPHHFSSAGDFFAYDVRTRVSYGQHFPGLRPGALRPTPAPLEGCPTAHDSVR